MQMYKIIILDFSMPEMDGPAVANEIRRRVGEKNIEIPYICCCTAYDDYSFRPNAKDYGMDIFTSKPLSYDELQ